MWRTSERASGVWNCSDCRAQGRVAARGNCGGPFAPEMLRSEGHNDYPDGTWEGARVRPDGRIEISAGRTMRPAQGLRGLSFTACPVAQAEAVAGEALRAYRAAESHTLQFIEPSPSAALMEAIDVVRAAVAEVRAYEAEARAAERKAGAA